MKKCPVCKSFYNDPTLNFCPEDGATLVAQTGRVGQPPGFAPLPQIPSRKKRNPLLWILGITGGIAFIGIVGIAGLIAFLAHSVSNNNNGKRLANTVINSNGGIYPVNSKTSNSSSGNSSSKDTGNIDFARWGERKTAMGQTKLVGDEFQLSAAQSGYY